ncbi:hypothetical protein Sarmat_00584 [Rickettsiales endosymbiont of Paramecium tredecaurelia]|uniref:hypothetical protein n=1 Tax=Candidatus Sarmatiella mevalonica TaxID=2770581 RepID=UPI0019230116|nr:hypothetical protein [Candidatus Sarmatiella mevalonica]MBL3284729.1 hypothetical protein [Candidatus Sarmatiella mevalonica]
MNKTLYGIKELEPLHIQSSSKLKQALALFVLDLAWSGYAFLIHEKDIPIMIYTILFQFIISFVICERFFTGLGFEFFLHNKRSAKKDNNRDVKVIEVRN